MVATLAQLMFLAVQTRMALREDTPQGRRRRCRHLALTSVFHHFHPKRWMLWSIEPPAVPYFLKETGMCFEDLDSSSRPPLRFEPRSCAISSSRAKTGAVELGALTVTLW